MIRGRFVTQNGGVKRPIVNANLVFPGPKHPPFFVRFIVDTGADSTTLGTVEVAKLQPTCNIDPLSLPAGPPSIGVGGMMNVRIMPNPKIDLGFGTSPISLPFLIVSEPNPNVPPIPSLLGRDVLSHFVLLMDEQNNKIRLLDRGEANQLLLNGQAIP